MNTKLKRPFFFNSLAVCLLVLGAGLTGQTPTAPTGPTVYTSDQATRGEKIYTQNCTSCHGLDLMGADGGPPLTGEWFDLSWEGRKISELFELVRATMPQSRPGSLSATQYADVVAFVLMKAGFSAGAEALPSDPVDLGDVVYTIPNKQREP